MKKIISFGIALGVTPLFAFAATAETVIIKVNQILAMIIPVLITLAVVYFIWGVIQFTVSTDEEAKKGARGKIINGLIGLFVIVAFWGIVRLISNTFGVGAQQIDQREIPCVPNPNAGVFC